MDDMDEAKSHCDVMAARHMDGRTSDSELDGAGEEKDIEGLVDEEIEMTGTQCRFSASV